MPDSIERAAQRIYLAHMFGAMMPNLSDVQVQYDDTAERIQVGLFSRLDGNKSDWRYYNCDITSDDDHYLFRLSTDMNCMIRIPLAE